MESFLIYGLVFLLVVGIFYIYLRKLKKASETVQKKIEIAKVAGLHEPVSLHPVVNKETCIKTGACILACPEKDILGIVDGKATLVNASRCIGHGACFHACPVEAITLCIGTEKRGVDLPHIKEDFETNVPGLYIAGELGGMGLIKNSVEQGKQAMDHIISSIVHPNETIYDVVIVGAGPAGISATLRAKEKGLKSMTLEQDSLGGTVFTFPRTKIVMTAPMDLPLHGKVKLYETNKAELLNLWEKVIKEHNISVREHSKVESVEKQGEYFITTLADGTQFQSKRVLLAIGRRGSPRKLGIPGEVSEKVAYRLIEPEKIRDRKVMVVGGGDSAIESAMLLADENEVILSYRGDSFKRIKPKNQERIDVAIRDQKVRALFNTNLTEIFPDEVEIKMEDESLRRFENDQVYIFAGGELPTAFLNKSGITITKRFGHTMLSHKKR